MPELKKLPCLDDVNRRSDDGGAEPGDDGRGEVARDAVLEEAVADERVLGDVVDDDLADVDDHVASDVREGAWNFNVLVLFCLL